MPSDQMTETQPTGPKVRLPLKAQPQDPANPTGFSWMVVDAERVILLDRMLQGEAEWWAKAGEYYDYSERMNKQINDDLKAGQE